MELHKPQVRKRTALISHARFGRRGAPLEDARLAGFLRRKDDDGRNAFTPCRPRAGQLKNVVKIGGNNPPRSAAHSCAALSQLFNSKLQQPVLPELSRRLAWMDGHGTDP